VGFGKIDLAFKFKSSPGDFVLSQLESQATDNPASSGAYQV
jgi:hypothetical protein